MIILKKYLIKDLVSLQEKNKYYEGVNYKPVEKNLISSKIMTKKNSFMEKVIFTKK